jgi:hypothetical protein
VTIGDIELERPLALLLLALPFALLLLVRLRARPEEDATGTLEIWRRAAAEQPTSAARSRRKIPLAIWLVCASLACAAVAAAGPRQKHEGGQSITIVVDRSPSMFLPSGSGIRLERPYVRLKHGPVSRGLAATSSIVTITWVSSGDVGGRGIVADDMPPEWKTPPRIAAPEIDFDSWDRPGVLFWTDRWPVSTPLQAGLLAGGGDAVPGPIGIHEGKLVVWDGTTVAVTSQAAPLRAVRIDPRVPESIARAARSWAAARGLAVAPSTPDPTIFLALELRSAVEANEPSLADRKIGRDGWTAQAAIGGRVPERDDDGGLENWLAGADGQALVRAGPGRIWIGLRALEEVRGDPASFVVSWSRLFDERVLLPPQCVPLSERLSAEPPGFLVPTYAESEPRAPQRWPVLLAAAALLFGLSALVAGARPHARELTAAIDQPRTGGVVAARK